MKLRVAWALGAVLALTALLAGAALAPASGHETRGAGDLRFVVGWGDEPPFTGLKNSVQVTVVEANGGPAVTDVGDSLKVEVSKGSAKMTLPLDPTGPSTPGDYRAWLTPTRPGAYTFRLFGSVRGQAVDESFTSSPATFDEVEDVAGIQFPAKDPSTGELATRIDREVPRMQARTDSVDARLREAADRVDTAQALGLAGAGAGALGLLGAAGALVAVRRGGRRTPDR